MPMQGIAPGATSYRAVVACSNGTYMAVAPPPGAMPIAMTSPGGALPMQMGAASAGMDPTRKIARQVGWLNRNTPLKVKVSYSDVVGPLSQLDVTDAMKILKDLEQVADQVDNPTGYVSAAAARASGVQVAPGIGIASAGASGYVQLAGGLQAAQSQMTLDPTGKIARQVGWLNRNASLQEPISFSDVVEPLSCLEISTAMAILKEVEENAPTIQSPTSYVLQAATRNGAHLQQDMVTTMPMVPMQLTLDPTGKIARQVGWLNKNAKLKEPISFSDVVEPLSQLDVTMAMQILKDLEGQAEHVRNPTGYVAAAASRAGAVSTGAVKGMMAPLQQMQHVPLGASTQQALGVSLLDPTGKIYRQVGWLNKNANLPEPLVFNDVVEPLSMLDIVLAMKILKELESDGSKVPDPTKHVLAACATNGAVATGDTPPLPIAADPTGKIARQVGWLNKNAKLSEPISFNDVVEPLSLIDVTAAMKILKEVEEQGAAIADPTGYVVTGANNARGSGAALPGVASLNAVAARPVALVSNQLKRTWHEEAAKPAADDEEAKQIARNVGRINCTVAMAEKLSYSDVKPHLEACGLEAASKILKDLEASAGSVKSPTSYVIAAAKRASSGESIPAKRSRV